MLEIKDIEKLAKLARIDLTDSEKNTLIREIDPILGYVAQIKEVSSKTPEAPAVGVHRNIMREDLVLNEGGTNTNSLIDEMPETEGNYLKVKKILG